MLQYYHHKKSKIVLELYHVVAISILGMVLVFIINSLQPYLFVNYSKARHALIMDGETDIKLLGYTPFGCYDNTPYHTRFSATNSYGDKVTGVVCSTEYDGSVIHFDNN